MAKIKAIVFFIVSLFLLGCNGSNSNEDSKKDEFYFSVKNSFHHIVLSTDKSKHIDLSENINMQGKGSVSIKKVNILSGACAAPIIEGTSLVITDNKSNLCKVSVEYLSNNNVQKSSDVTYIISSGEKGDILPILNLDKTLEQTSDPFVIDLKASLGSDYPFEYYLVNSFVLGNGQVESDVTNNTLSFSTNQVGSTRIYYSLASDNPDNKPVFGYINANITSDKIIPPKANNITFNRDVVAGEIVTVNLNELTAINEGTVPLSEVQVTDVYMLDTYNAALVEIENQNDLRNVEFTFQSQYQGKYYVSYYISDHLGNSDIGIVEINVKPAYDLIFLPEVGIFTAPLTVYDILDTGYEITDDEHKHTENGKNGPSGLEIALFSQVDAQRYCSDIGMVLATALQLEKLDSSALGTTIFSKYNWPQSNLFWGFENNGAYNFKKHKWVDEAPVDNGYFTCVLQLDNEEVTIHSKDKLFVGQSDDAYLTTKLVTGKEIVIPDEYVKYSVEHKDILDIDIDKGDISALAFGTTNITGTLIDSSISDSKKVDVVEYPIIEMKVKAYIQVGETTPVTFEISYDGGKSWQSLPKEIVVQNITMEPDNLATISDDGVNKFNLTGDYVGDVVLTAHTNHPEIDKYIDPKTVIITSSDVCLQFGYFDDIHGYKYCIVYDVDEFMRIPGLEELIADDRGIINNNPYVYPENQNKFCRLIGADEYLIPKNYGVSRFIGNWIPGWTDENALTARLVKERYENHETKPGRRMQWHAHWSLNINKSYWEGWIDTMVKSDIVAPTCLYKDQHINPSASAKKRFIKYSTMIRNVILVDNK